jgi:glutamate racemase
MDSSGFHSAPTTPRTPVGIFDSGVGGLSVLRALRRLLPYQPILYLADQAHVPYGARTQEEVRAFAEEITRFLLRKGARLIVVACNAASAAALYHLRGRFPDVPFVGMEPAVKPAAAATRSGVVGVLATPVTFQGTLYASVIDRFARGITVLEDTCPGLVGEIESGRLHDSQARIILERALQPMLARGADTIVMGCTHYPFVIPLIQELVGPDVQVIDPAPAVARQAARLLQATGLLVDTPPAVEPQFFTSGPAEKLIGILPLLLGEKYPVQVAGWHYGKLS